jgi:hypothetical protein
LDGKLPLRRWIKGLLVCCVVALLVSGWLIIVAPDSVPGKPAADSMAAKTTSQSTPESQLVQIGWIQCGIFLAQLIVFYFQAIKLQETVTAAGAQSEDMKHSIEQATRAANAMERSADAATTASRNVVVVTERSVLHMRAYLSVRIHLGIYQERTNNLRFEVRPLLINTGQTPAYEVRYVANADVLEFPLPDGFSFPPLGDAHSIFGLLAPQQTMIMGAVVRRDFFEDVEAEQIKRGWQTGVHLGNCFLSRCCRRRKVYELCSQHPLAQRTKRAHFG